MSVAVRETVVIEQPIELVATYAGDPSNAPEWRRRLETATWQTDPPARLGSRIAFTGRFLGRAIEDVYEVVEYSPGEQITMRTTDGPFPTRTVSTWRPVGGRVTHMTLTTHSAPTGVGRLLTPLVRRALRREMRADLALLKQILER